VRQLAAALDWRELAPAVSIPGRSKLPHFHEKAILCQRDVASRLADDRVVSDAFLGAGTNGSTSLPSALCWLTWQPVQARVLAVRRLGAAISEAFSFVKGTVRCRSRLPAVSVRDAPGVDLLPLMRF